MLGDLVESVLSSVGLTQEQVERWLGRPCRCKERQEKLNRLQTLLARFVSGKIGDVSRYFDELLRES